MIELFRPLAAIPSDVDGWLPVLLTGDETRLVGAGPRAVAFGGSLGYASPLLPVEVQALRGHKLPAYGGDLYERLHLSSSLLALGNVIGNQQRTITVWNAYTRAQELSALTASNDEGLTMAGGPGALPYSFAALEEQVYTLTVGTDGPPTIDASYVWDFAPYDLVLRVTGSRVTAWSFAPDWSSPILERLDWLTDVLQAYDASEQRSALRLAPRKTYEFESFFDAPTRRYAEAVLFGWGARVWALPVWPDGQDIGQDVPAGTTSLLIDTTTRDFEQGSLAIVMSSPREFEVLEVLSVAPSALTLKRPTSRDWGAGSMIYPARLARLQDQVRASRWTGGESYVRAVFTLDEPVDYVADAGAATHRGQPVLERRPNWTGGFDIDLARNLAELDPGTGRRFFDDEAKIAIPLQRMRFSMDGRQDCDAFRRLLYALRGRWRALWVPTWCDDLVLAELVSATQTFLDVEWCAYTLQIAQQPNRRDLRIELVDGTVLYRRVTASQELSQDRERLAIDSGLGRNVAPADVAKISFMALARLDSDSIELAHWTGAYIEAATVFRSMRSEL